MTSTDSRMRPVVYTMTALVLVSVVLQIIGTATPCWLVIEDGEYSLHMGLWHVRMCTGNVCTTTPIVLEDEWFKTSAHFEMTTYRTYRALTTTAIILGLICVPVFLYAVRKLTDRNLAAGLLIGIHMAFLSGIQAISAAGKFFNNDIGHYGFKSPYGVPYSLILTGLGGILSIVATLVIGRISWRVWFSDKEDGELVSRAARQVEAPMMAYSAARMAVHPVATSPLLPSERFEADGQLGDRAGRFQGTELAYSGAALPPPPFSESAEVQVPVLAYSADKVTIATDPSPPPYSAT